MNIASPSVMQRGDRSELAWRCGDYRRNASGKPETVLYAEKRYYNTAGSR